ncbi:DUF3179 domain-containing protein [Halofilum ochraceum]|uniref:DUF3179 domain-containing protein n=1 Tax=Halofilum ochraceum TaxID=1611323 RepID=UPI0009F409F5|nr:DUF3179 domain-containing protein [Halofilum ochraceum]
MRYTRLLAALLMVGTSGAIAEPPTDQAKLMNAPLSEYRDNIRTGASKDGIPSIDDPVFQDAEAADAFLDDNDRVIGIYINGEARAYPQRILVWHEIVNDTVAGDPVSVTYCPLTGTGLGFHRNGVEFGVSGKLLNSNLVMYDRETESRWPQILAAGISGPLAGEGLREFRTVFTEWGRWKERYPDTRVLSTDTGIMRNYQQDPYGNYNPVNGYYAPDSSRMFPVMNDSDRYPPKQEVLGFRGRDHAVAVDLGTLRDAGVIERRIDGTRYVIIHDPGLDTGWVYRGDAAIDPGAIDFGPEGPRFDGRNEMEPVNAFRAMWFAWAAFYPDTAVIDDATGET